MGGVALVKLPREEEPQISVPMVDVLVTANGYKAQDAAELITKPLEDILKGVNGVEHVYSLHPGRFRRRDRAILCRHRRGRGADPHPREDPQQHRRPAEGHPDAADHRARRQRCGDPDADAGAEAAGRGALGRQRALPGGAGTAARAGQGRQCRAHLHRRRQPEPDPRRARPGTIGALRHHAKPARRQAGKRQPLLSGRRV